MCKSRGIGNGVEIEKRMWCTRRERSEESGNEDSRIFSGLISVCTRSHSSCKYCSPINTCLAITLTSAFGTPFFLFLSMSANKFSPSGSKTIQTWEASGPSWQKLSRKETMYCRPGCVGEKEDTRDRSLISSRAVSA